MISDIVFHDPSYVVGTAISLPKYMPSKRQTPQRRNVEQAKAIKRYDLATNVLADIHTLAGLLEAVGTRTNAEPVDARLISMTGNMIARRADDLRKVLRSSLSTYFGNDSFKK